MGHDVLKQVSEPIANPTAPEIARLAQDMSDTCEDIGGNGIASPPVYEPARMFAYRVRKRGHAERRQYVGNPLKRGDQSKDHAIE
jgi:peptide deformylase